MFEPLAKWAQKRYQASLADRLRDYGLRYDDLYDPLMDMVSGVGWGGVGRQSEPGCGWRGGPGFRGGAARSAPLNHLPPPASREPPVATLTPLAAPL
jgi:hypothetical protein